MNLAHTLMACHKFIFNNLTTFYIPKIVKYLCQYEKTLVNITCISMISAQSEEIAHCEIFLRIYKSRTKWGSHKVKPHKVRATCTCSCLTYIFRYIGLNMYYNVFTIRLVISGGLQLDHFRSDNILGDLHSKDVCRICNCKILN